MSLALWVALVAVAVAAVTDLRARRIPNWLTASLALSALALHAFDGWQVLLTALATGFGAFFAGSFAFARGWLGGGDVKLIAAVAAALAWPDTALFLLYTALGGGVLAVVVAGARGRLGATLRGAFHLATPLLFPGTVALQPRESVHVPYALAIAFGTYCVVLTHSLTPALRIAL